MRVFERSSRGLVGRGGGIGTPGSVIAELVSNDVIDRDMPRFAAQSMPFVVRTSEERHRGYVPWAMPLDLETFRTSLSICLEPRRSGFSSFLSKG